MSSCEFVRTVVGTLLGGLLGWLITSDALVLWRSITEAFPQSKALSYAVHGYATLETS